MPRLALLALLACAPDAEDPNAQPPSNGAGDCSDSAVSPWVGTCVETFFEACFAPEGTCSGTVDFTGALELAWSGGARVSSEAHTDDPLVLDVDTVAVDAGGDTCATAQTASVTTDCFTETVWTRASDEAVLALCSSRRATLVVSCPDGSFFEVSDAERLATWQTCWFGGTEPCVIDVVASTP